MPLGEKPQFQARVQRHLPLVRLMVNRFKRRLPPGFKAEGLYRMGVVGLVRAAGHGRADCGGRFRVYVSARIRGAILDELRRLDRLSRPRRAKARRLARAIARLEQERGGEVGREALRMELQREEAELQALMDEALLARYRIIKRKDSDDVRLAWKE